MTATKLPSFWSKLVFAGYLQTLAGASHPK